jgi:hypothetical protein
MICWLIVRVIIVFTCKVVCEQVFLVGDPSDCFEYLLDTLAYADPTPVSPCHYLDSAFDQLLTLGAESGFLLSPPYDIAGCLRRFL